MILYLQNYASDTSSNTMHFMIVLNTKKNSFINPATQKNACQIFLPKKVPELKISNPQNPLIISII